MFNAYAFVSNRAKAAQESSTALSRVIGDAACAALVNIQVALVLFALLLFSVIITAAPYAYCY